MWKENFFENEAFRNRWGFDNHVISLPYPPFANRSWIPSSASDLDVSMVQTGDTTKQISITYFIEFQLI